MLSQPYISYCLLMFTTNINIIMAWFRILLYVFAVISFERTLTDDSCRSYCQKYVCIMGKIGDKTVIPCTVDRSQATNGYFIEWRKGSNLSNPFYSQVWESTGPSEPLISSLLKNRIRTISPDATLVLNNIKGGDRGLYLCRIQYLNGNQHDSDTLEQAYLCITSTPTIVKSSSTHLHTKTAGENIDFFCETTGTPVPKLEWLKDGGSFNVNMNSSRIIVQTSNYKTQLSIKGILSKDGGKYTCVASNIGGQASQNFKLIVAGSAHIMEFPRNISVLEFEQAAVMKCEAQGYPGNISYSWMHNGVLIGKANSLIAPGIKSKILKSGSLHFKQVDRSQSGWYTCVVSNGLGQPAEASAYMDVHFRPEITRRQMEPAYIPLGMAAVLPCHYVANPLVTKVEWRRDGQELNTFKSPNLYMDEKWNLHFLRVRPTDAGTYTCLPFNIHGSGDRATLHVRVMSPPRFIFRPKPVYKKVKGQNVTLPCYAIADKNDPRSKPTVSWQKNDDTLFLDDGHHYNDGHNLSIIHLNKFDHGTYSCIAENEAAMIITSTRLIISSTTPHPPYNVTVMTTSSSAVIRWDPGWSGGDSQLFSIWYRIYGSETWKHFSVPFEDSTHYTIGGLLPATRYEFMVVAKNQFGDGDKSKVVIVSTKQAPFTTQYVTVPPGQSGKDDMKAPTNFSLKITYGNGSQYNNVTLMWFSPRSEKFGVYYMIEYKIDEDNSENVWRRIDKRLVAPRSTNENTVIVHTIANIKSNLWYFFRVLAFSNDGSYFSSPTLAAKPLTSAESTSSNERSNAAILWGIIGSLVFLFLCVLLAIFVIHFCGAKRRSHRQTRKKHKHSNTKSNSVSGSSNIKKYKYEDNQNNHIEVTQLNSHNDRNNVFQEPLKNGDLYVKSTSPDDSVSLNRNKESDRHYRADLDQNVDRYIQQYNESHCPKHQYHPKDYSSIDPSLSRSISQYSNSFNEIPETFRPNGKCVIDNNDLYIPECNYSHHLSKQRLQYPPSSGLIRNNYPPQNVVRFSERDTNNSQSITYQHPPGTIGTVIPPSPKEILQVEEVEVVL